MVHAGSLAWHLRLLTCQVLQLFHFQAGDTLPEEPVIRAHEQRVVLQRKIPHHPCPTRHRQFKTKPNFTRTEPLHIPKRKK